MGCVMIANPKYGPRFECKTHLKHVASKSCCVCGHPPPNQAHHPISTESRRKLGKAHDYETVTLCITHHAGLHDWFGSEEDFINAYGMDFEKEALRMVLNSPSKKIKAWRHDNSHD